MLFLDCHLTSPSPGYYYESFASTVVLVTAVVGEIALALYLVVRGVKPQQPTMSEAA